jgi:Big-like domain-containing protein
MATVLPYAEKSLAPGFPVLLQITSPADGTVVHLGQTITVAVTPTSGNTFTRVMLMGDQPFATILSQGGPPYQFSFTVPQTIDDARKYRIHAIGARQGQQPAISPDGILDVEPAFPITKMWLPPNTCHF